MQKLFFILCIACLSLKGFSQKVDIDRNELYKFDQKRVSIQKNAMLVLGGWSAVNLGVSAFATKTNDPAKRYFHQMNVMWSGINLGFAALGYWGATKENIKNPTLKSVLKHQSTSEKTFLLNTGLDAAYIATGLYLWERSKTRKDPNKLEGYGNSIMFQGGFLLIFDAVNYVIHNQRGKKLNNMLNKIELSGGAGSMSMVYRLN